MASKKKAAAKPGKKITYRSTYEALKAHGAKVGKTDILMMAPEEVTLYFDNADHPHFIKGIDIVSKEPPFYDPSINLPIDEQFLEDIRSRGYDTPIAVAKNGETKNGRPIMPATAGRQRVLTGREINKRHPGTNIRVPARQRTGGALDMLKIALAENAEHVNRSPLSAAWKLREAVKLGMTKEEACALLRIKGPAYDDLMAFLDMEPEIQNAFETKKLARGNIGDVAKAPREKQGKVVKAIADHVAARGGGKAKKHEVKAIAAAVANDEPVPALPARLKVLGRYEMERLIAAGEKFNFDDEEDLAVCAAVEFGLELLKHVLGHRDAMSEGKFKRLRKVFDIELAPKAARG